MTTNDQFHPDPFGQDKPAAMIVAAMVPLSVLLFLAFQGFTLDPYQWGGENALLPLWADLLATAVFVPIVAYGLFIVLAAYMRMIEATPDP